MQKLLRKFPLRLLIGTIFLCLFFLNVQAQNKKLSVSYSNVPLEEVIKDLSKKTGYKFFYNNIQMDKIKPITLSKENIDVEDLLKLVLSNTPLTYRIINSHIVIKRKDTGKSNYENVKKINAVIAVTDALDHSPIAGIVGQLLDIGIYGVADSDGIITFANIPQGEHILNLQMLGYEKYTNSIILNSDKQISIKLNATSLALEEVNVVAHKVKNSLSTVSEISRQALDHAQAISLQDVLEFLPGQALNFGKTMTSVEQLSFRTLQTDKNNSFGAAVIVDGVPISNNTSLELQGGSVASTAGAGIDLRSIATDNIESVELIRGVPSAEYGDLSSGAIVVKSKVGKSPLNTRFKINPGIIQASISKGFDLKKNNRIINVNADYLNASGDPRQKNSSVDRINTTMSYSTTSKSKWQNTTRFSFNTLLSKTSNNDPESIADGNLQRTKITL